MAYSANPPPLVMLGWNAATRCPTVKLEMPSPTVEIVPEMSSPALLGVLFQRADFLVRRQTGAIIWREILDTNQSLGFIATATTLMQTSSGPGMGMGESMILT
jgi:hypothetical protein